MSGWGVLGILVFGYEWHRRKGWSALIAPWPLFLPFLFLVAGQANSGLCFGSDAVRYKIGIWFKAMRDQSMRLDILTLLIVAFALLVALRQRKFDGRLGWAALILLVLTIAMPRHLGGGDYADWRLIAVALMIGCLAMDWRVPRWAFYLAPALFLLRLGVTTYAWHDQSEEMEVALGALDQIPQGSVVAGAVAVPASQWGVEPLEHAPSYAAVRRDALVNSHFALEGIHMLQLRGGVNNFVDPSQRIIHSPGEQISLAEFAPAKNADYLWYFGREQPANLPAGAKIIHRTPISFLARLANAPGRR